MRITIIPTLFALLGATAYGCAGGHSSPRPTAKPHIVSASVPTSVPAGTKSANVTAAPKAAPPAHVPPRSAAPAPTVPPEVHHKALEYAVRAAQFSLTNPNRAIKNYKLALRYEPNNREWQSLEAFWLNDRGRTAEALPIWKSLAGGSDKFAEIARRRIAHAAHKKAEPVAGASGAE